MPADHREASARSCNSFFPHRFGGPSDHDSRPHVFGTPLGRHKRVNPWRSRCSVSVPSYSVQPARWDAVQQNDVDAQGSQNWTTNFSLTNSTTNPSSPRHGLILRRLHQNDGVLTECSSCFEDTFSSRKEVQRLFTGGRVMRPASRGSVSIRWPT